MKKIWVHCAALLLFLMLSIPAQAADVICVEPNALGAELEYSIMQATLENGQIIYYLGLEKEPKYKMEDVNFDGYEDFVPITTLGARNFFSSFYVYNPQTARYEPVYTGDQGFCNYTLVPEKGYVISSVNDGYLYRDIKIYQWQNDTLVLLRRGMINGFSTVEFDDDGMVERWDFDQYEVVIYDYTTGEDNGQLIYQEIHPEDSPQHEAHLAQFDAKLWEGL